MQDTVSARRISITGIVQGVGFRPFVYRLAQDYRLTGWVLNTNQGVQIYIEGAEEYLDSFQHHLVEDLPPLALIRTIEIETVKVAGFTDFHIRHSEGADEKTAMIPPDIAICADCRQEVHDPHNRRFHYPFTNCTNCGPRFTIIRDLPYDRAMTTMAGFPMCPICQAEYDDPGHRRFHAQPNACPACGPQLQILDREQQPVADDATSLLKAGKILAVKGLGAFHLAIDARNPMAVAELRRRKQRDAKPFAVMARDITAAECYCHISDLERQWLISPSAPIVVLHERTDSGLPVNIIHPGLSTLGMMLPYTPLHYLLFDQELDLLIMTSANISDEPLIIDNATAWEQLIELADYFLLHNRDIVQPCDDSVMTITPLATPQLLRRARGFVPRGILLPQASRPLLALGGEMKNTFCLSRNGEAFLSQHWGDLNHYRNYIRFQEGLKRFQQLLAIEPELLVHDLHPDYQTTRWAKQQSLPRLAVQHHHAHLASAMADNGLNGEVLGLICDGSGWGPDGAVWGGELLRGGYQNYQRLGHLRYMLLPGGEITIRRPYRMAFAYLLTALEGAVDTIADNYLPDLSPEERSLLLQQLHAAHPRLITSSCGRLFDAVGALLGISPISRYEGQTAIELEAIADPGERGIYSWQVYQREEQLIMDPVSMWPEMIYDLEHRRTIGSIAQKFHISLAAMFSHALVQARELSALNRVVLSGGCFHNKVLLFELIRMLDKCGFEVYHHQQVPPGDGGIALGQVAIACEVKI